MKRSTRQQAVESLEARRLLTDATFSAATNFGAGLSPAGVIVSDFNGDKIADLAVADFSTPNTDDGGVSVLLGNGSGGFGSAKSFLTNRNPKSLTAGDFNGDGKMDLAVANAYSDNVSILLGNGAGLFATAVNYNVQQRPLGIVTADFNGDRKLDLAVANTNSNSVSILLGNGAGTFSAATDFTVGSKPSALVLGFFNGDSNLDIATANSTGSNYSIILGNGSGGFSSSTDFTAGTLPGGIASGDFNGDGKADLVVANVGFPGIITGNLTVSLGDGAGAFSNPPTSQAATNPAAVVVGDFNLDGLADISTAQTAGSARTRVGLGTGAFAATVTDSTAGTNSAGIAVGDFNGDHKPDLVVANSGTNNVSILLNTSTLAGAITGNIFYDTNANGARETEPGFVGWTVYLDTNNNNVKDAGELSTTTDSVGNYLFAGLPNGTYHVKQILQTGYHKTKPAGIPGYDVTIAGGSVSTGNDFGDTSNVYLAGIVFNDLNGDGIQQLAQGENGINGVTVQIKDNNGVLITSRTTANGQTPQGNTVDGFWQVRGLSAGTGEVSIVIPAGRVATKPVGGKITGSASSGQQIGNLNFGTKLAAPAPSLAAASPAIVTGRYSGSGFFDDSDSLFA